MAGWRAPLVLIGRRLDAEGAMAALRRGLGEAMVLPVTAPPPQPLEAAR